jgi:C-terminal processing protease CtpA/Prc
MEFLENLLIAIITASVPILTTYLCSFLKSLYDNNKANIKNERTRFVLGQVTDMIAAAVETTTSTYVQQLKSDNLFNKEAQKEAFKKTYDAVTKQLTKESMDIITENFGDMETYLTNQIERFVEELKK